MLQGKVCLVTGARKGIGKAIATRFAKERAIVFANARTKEDIESWSNTMKLSGKIIPLAFDITDSKAMRDALIRIKKEYGQIDVLVNNAGVISYEPISMVSKIKFEEMLKVNVVAVFELIQNISRMMIPKQSGNIINITSMVGVNGASGQAAYSASKGAVISLTKSAAKELAVHQIRVNAIAPGMVKTERFANEMQTRFPHMESCIKLGRLADVNEIADACLFLASDMSSYITGQILGVDGCAIF